MNVHLSPRQEQLVAQALQSGLYSTADDVIGRALDVLHEQDEWLIANRQALDTKIRAGIAELERGEGIPEDKLQVYLAKLKAETE